MNEGSCTEVLDLEREVLGFIPRPLRLPGQYRVCFFVLCKRHWINRVPGAHRGDVTASESGSLAS